MDIRFNCPHCGQHLSVEERGAGMIVNCPSCKEQIEIPHGTAPEVLKEPLPTAAPPNPKPVAKLATRMSDLSNVERNAIVGCCVLSLLLFFFPLLTIQIPIAGKQDVSGYDVFSKLTEFREKLKPPDALQTNPHATTPRTAPRDMPLSIQLGWLTPLAIIVAFVCAAIALLTAFKAIHISRIICVIGAICAVAAILHITIMNSDLHSWLAESMKTAQSDNPFAGLAALMLNAFQIKPGWGVYALLVLLGLAAVLGFSRALSRLRVAPADS
jgi:hypothetical protein